MQGRKLFSLSALMILLALCFISVPGFAGDHPWDIDGGDDDRDIRGVELPDGAEGQSDMDIECVDRSSGPSTSLSATPPVVQFIVKYVFSNWAMYSDLSVNQYDSQAQRTEISRSKRSSR